MAGSSPCSALRLSIFFFLSVQQIEAKRKSGEAPTFNHFGLGVIQIISVLIMLERTGHVSPPQSNMEVKVAPGQAVLPWSRVDLPSISPLYTRRISRLPASGITFLAACCLPARPILGICYAAPHLKLLISVFVRVILAAV